MLKCTITNCVKKHYATGYCISHYGRKWRLKLIEELGGQTCKRCGKDDVRCLQIDHINGGGRKDSSKYSNNQQMYKFYLKNIDKMRSTLRVLCVNCNWITRFQNNGQNINKQKLKIMNMLNQKSCIHCGFCDLRALQLDHINGGGNEDRRKNKEYNVYGYYIKNYIKALFSIQILCANCNWVKVYENNECYKNA